MTKYDPKVTPWQINEQDFPRDEDSTEKSKFLLRYAILAPSSHNTQPWKFSIGEDEIRIFVDKTRWLKVADSDQRELHVSIGCALENLLIAAEHFGYALQVTYFPEPGNEELAAVVCDSRRGNKLRHSDQRRCSRPSSPATQTARPTKRGPSSRRTSSGCMIAAWKWASNCT